jgi:hypothetical protein
MGEKRWCTLVRRGIEAGLGSLLPVVAMVVVVVVVGDVLFVGF